MSGDRTAGRQPVHEPPRLHEPTIAAPETSGPARHIQAKLVVGAADDPYEREADRMADLVLSLAVQSDPLGIRRRSRDGRIARRTGVVPIGREGGVVDAATEARIGRSSGRPLPPDTRASMEAGFGSDFGGVRVHTNSPVAPELGAVAFTSGADIHFARGAYSPQTRDGQHLLAHELTHVVQQQGPVRRAAGPQGTAATIVQRRSENPHNPQTSITSHHIIPHELLAKLINKFEGADQAKVLRGFLPTFGTLTLAKLVAQNTTAVTFDGEPAAKVKDLPAEVAHIPFATLSEEAQAKCKFRLEDIPVTDFAGFQELWNNAIAGAPGKAFGEIAGSFYEWQGGNLFYGPERIEPGAKDAFDFDAALIYGEDHAKKLETIYNELRSLQKKEDDDSKKRIAELLAEMNAAAKNVGVPKYDPTLWHEITTSNQKLMIDAMLPKRKATSKVKASIHVQVLRDAITAYSEGEMADTMLHAMTPVVASSEPVAETTPSPATPAKGGKGGKTKVAVGPHNPFITGDATIALRSSQDVTHTVDPLSRGGVSTAMSELLHVFFALG